MHAFSFSLGESANVTTRFSVGIFFSSRLRSLTAALGVVAEGATCLGARNLLHELCKENDHGWCIALSARPVHRQSGCWCDSDGVAAPSE